MVHGGGCEGGGGGDRMTTEKAPSEEAMAIADSIKLSTHWNGGVGNIRTWDDVRADIAAALDAFAANALERVLSNDKAIQNIAVGYAAQLKAAADYADALCERNRALVAALTAITVRPPDDDG